jgi:hypothetical protein
MMTLTQLANKYASDKGTEIPQDGKHHGPRLHFTTQYEKTFEAIRNQAITFLEIGIGGGPSLKMWYDYFPNATIHAIDIENYTYLNNDKVTTYIADQSSRESLQQFLEKANTAFDIIIDDGGHMMQQQQVSFGTLFSFLKSNGQYWVEDLHTSFWPINDFKDLYGTTLDINEKRTNTTYDFLQRIVDTQISSSEFLTADENQYLTDNITHAEMFTLPETIYGPNKLAYFVKK